ncbi:LuxR C-terminal-related transcriptional regulator [Ktedonospora formicarum]|uniref:LuxR family transcriptional regulator n=1 Tax=Ktedonospora formicarum TaxID=2778364 RepID=A0A8J3MUW4_9CHLR|nr:LuxR C-terminal-related transcriptional regulator [Ktedonospora formicarum]GHO49782.1 LuxR family transcriptional regulator [Ktedonospora formicarum]
MPKTAKYTLSWSVEYACYQLATRGEADIVPIYINDEQWWYTWLEEHTSFAFNGQNGHLTLLKEAREQRGKSYWYAYQRQGAYTKKRYAGRSRELSIVHLEDIAAHFQSINQRGEAPTQSHIPSIVPPPTENAPPLLLPKIQPPRLATSLVTRTDLLARLDAGLYAKLTMVVAPAGFGKTTLVRQWIAAHSTDTLIAWVALDTHDNDPQRFWRYICAACQTFGISTDFLAVDLSHNMASFPFAAPSLIESVLTPLLNNLTQMKGHGILVLDDYQVIQKPLIQQTLMFLLDYLPSTLHILLLSRSIPSLPLARLRSRGEVYDIGAGDLRFSVAETTDFLRSTSKFLTPEIIERITMRLEGWPAGLCMFALNLPHYQSLEEIERHLNTVSGSDHSWQDYFVREVLETQPKFIQHFLLQTSILDRLTGSLCCALTDNVESTSVLETLFQKNLFLEKVEGEGDWYRYHQLFAEAMRHEASRRLEADAQRELFQRASDWYEQHAMLPEAIEAAFNARQLPRVAQLLSHFTKISTTATTQFDLLKLVQAEYWLSQIPYELFDKYPDLYIAYVTSLAFSHGPDNMTPETLTLADQLLSKVEHIWRTKENYQALGIAFAYHSMISYRQGNLARAVEFARQALNWLSDIWSSQKAICWTIIGICAFQARQFELSRQAHQASCNLWDTQRQLHGVRGNTVLMALACLELGEMQQAAAYLQWALDEANRYDDLNDAALSRLGLAHIYYAWNELDRARQMALAITTILTEQENPEIHIRAELILAKVQCGQSQFSAARQRMGALLARPSSRSSSLLYYEIVFHQARLLYFMNDLYAAQRSLRLLDLVEQPPHLTAESIATDTNSSGLVVYEAAGANQDIDEQRTLLDARLLLAQGNAREACELLMDFFLLALAGRLNRAILEALALFVLALITEHRLQEATKTLHMLLSRTLTENYLRLFLDEGEPMARALRTLLPSIHEKAQRAYLLTILHAFPSSQTAQPEPMTAALLLEPLSSQETRVLRLLVAGRRNLEIARELIVSVNTIRTQVRSIYRKLNVTNRVEASNVAHELQLL